jgi:hypothetical protein
MFIPPNGTRGSDGLTPIKCSKCLPTCHNSRYAIDYSLVDDSHWPTTESNVYLDVFYKELSAVKFRQELAFDLMDLVG